MTISSKSTIFLASLLAVLLAACSGHDHQQAATPPAVAVEVARAQAQDNGTIYASGQIISRESAVISTRIMGYITSVKVKPGDRVKKGQLLLTISNEDIQAKRGQAQSLVVETSAALKDAQKDYERFTALYQSESASAKEYENVSLQYQSIKARNEGALQMLREAEAMLAYANIVAPFSGVVTSKSADAGSIANPGVPLLTLEGEGDLEVNATVTDAEIGWVTPGMPASVVIKSTGKIVKGMVSQVSPSAALTGGQYFVKISFKDTPAQVYAGMAATVSIPVTKSGHAGTVTVPWSAIVQQDQLTALYTVSQQQTALLRWVKLGRRFGDQVEVLSGLNATEEFILSGEGKLYNGVPVKKI